MSEMEPTNRDNQIAMEIAHIRLENAIETTENPSAKKTLEAINEQVKDRRKILERSREDFARAYAATRNGDLEEGRERFDSNPGIGKFALGEWAKGPSMSSAPAASEAPALARKESSEAASSPKQQTSELSKPVTPTLPEKQSSEAVVSVLMEKTSESSDAS